MDRRPTGGSEHTSGSKAHTCLMPLVYLLIKLIKTRAGTDFSVAGTSKAAPGSYFDTLFCALFNQHHISL